MNGAEPWRPGNEDGVSYGPVTLDRAMARSMNTVYAQLGMDVGIDRVADAAVDAGLPKDTPGLESGASVALGTATPSVLDMASAYATFAAQGNAAPAHPVDRVVRNGDTVALPSTRPTRVFDQDVANSVTRVLQDVVETGTGTRAQILGRPTAGKTGTTDDNRSAWFIGYTPQLSTAVGMFRQDPVTNAHLSMRGTAGYNRVDGGNIPTRIWATYMRDALAGRPVLQFPRAGNPGPAVPVSSGGPGASAAPTPTGPGGTKGVPVPVTGLPGASPVPRPTGWPTGWPTYWPPSRPTPWPAPRSSTGNGPGFATGGTGTLTEGWARADVAPAGGGLPGH
jgi:membrane peptidoglycan carboxypeptidase